MLATELAGRKSEVIDIASGRRIVFKDQSAPVSAPPATIAAAPHDSPGFFLSARTDIEVVPANDVIITPVPPPIMRPPPTAKIVRPRFGDGNRTPAPISRNLVAKPLVTPQLIAYVVAGILVVAVLILVFAGGRHQANEPHGSRIANAPVAPAVPVAPDARPSDLHPQQAPIDHTQAPQPIGVTVALPGPPVPSAPTVATAPTALREPGGPGLVVHYPFDDAANIGKDTSTHHSALASVVGATCGFDPIMKRQVLILLGHCDITIAPRPVTRDFTLAVWVTTGVTGYPAKVDGTVRQWFYGFGLVDADIGGAHADFGTSIFDGHFAFGIGDPDTTLCSTSTISDGRWHHLVAKRANTGKMQVCIDGLQEAACDGPSGDRNAPTQMVIGRVMSGENFLVARLSNLRIYDRVISDSEIMELVHAEGPVP
jgi:hypothetical protein